ncbi:baseplate J/gp47 family protein [Paenibacillus residui]|uniref:Baseplate J/gp47 family protein n=1 Tax=Paenibacillus residui TaxID=629724 RepID=A0ABW3D930_9BACL
MAALPDYLTDQTEERIRQRMFRSLPPDLDKSEGSFIWDSLSPTAIELAQAAIWAQEVLRRAFAATNFGSYLDLKVAERGLSRRAAIKATSTVTFEGEPGRPIPSGTVVATEADSITDTPSIEYETTEEAIIGESGQVTVPIIALVAGKAGNVPAGAIRLISTPIRGVSNVTNQQEITSGADEESDDSLRERYFAMVRSPGTSGNKADYIRWAMEVPGVGGVQVLPIWKGPGTVGVFLLDTEKRAASPAIVEAVQQHIDPDPAMGEGTAPIGPDITIAAGEEIPINVNAKLTLASEASLDTVKKLIESGLKEYLKSLAFVDPIVRYTRISAILLDIPPIIDFQELKVNGTYNENIEIFSGQVAVPGVVTVYES